MADALAIWSNLHVVRLFRTLDEHRLTRTFYARAVAAGAVLRRVAAARRGLAALTAEVARQRRVRQVRVCV